MNVCLYSCLSYPARKSHVFCAALFNCHLWPVWLYHIIPHSLTNGKDFRQKLKIKCVFTLQIVFTTFIVLRIILRDIIHVHRSSYKVPVILVRF